MIEAPLVNQTPIRVKKSRYGAIMYNANDAFVGRSFDLYGEFSELEFQLFQQIIKPGMAALDIGANIGAHTVPMAQIVGAKGSIIAFEPQRLVYQMLCGNLALNGIMNVHAYMLGVGKAAGIAQIPAPAYNQAGNFGGVSLLANAGTIPHEDVRVVALDQLNLTRCEFIKIDVEGMEQQVIEGAAQTLQRFKPLLYVENDRLDRSEKLIRTLLDSGYRLYWHLPPLFNPRNFYGNSENVFANIVSINMLCIPQSLDVGTLQNFREITHENAHQHPLARPNPA